MQEKLKSFCYDLSDPKDREELKKYIPQLVETYEKAIEKAMEKFAEEIDRQILAFWTNGGKEE